MKKITLALTTLFASSLIAFSASAMVAESNGYDAFGDAVQNHALSQG